MESRRRELLDGPSFAAIEQVVHTFNLALLLHPGHLAGNLPIVGRLVDVADDTEGYGKSGYFIAARALWM